MKKALLIGVLVAVIVLGATGLAAANTVTYGPATTPVSNGASPVVVQATINAKVQMSITTTGGAQTLDFGTLDPGSSTGTDTVVIQVNSNKSWTMDKALSNPGILGSLNMTTKYAAGSNILGGATAPSASGTTVTDEFKINGVPWNTAPGAYTTNVTYTVIAP